METPLVSVLMTTHNYGRFIGEAIESVLGQTYENFELIIIDDASIDNTLDVIDGFCDDRIVLIQRAECSCSPAAARNDGLAIAQGEFIAIADADDINLPDRFEKQVTFFGYHPHIDLLGGAMIKVNEANVPLEDPIRRPQFEDQQQYRQALLGGKIMILNPTKMFRRHILERLKAYRHFQSAGDMEFLLRASRYYNMYNLEDVLVYWRHHPTSVTHSYGWLLNPHHDCIFLFQEYMWLQKEVERLEHEAKTQEVV